VHRRRRDGVVDNGRYRPGGDVKEDDDDDRAIPAEGRSEQTSGLVFGDGWLGNATTNHLMVSDDDSGGRVRRTASNDELTTTMTTAMATMQLMVRQRTNTDY
jgi:hypothetical protein